jgi:hypothetical protein
MSGVEAILRSDPAGVYPRMDFRTRNEYRQAIERLARRSDHAEEAIAQTAIDLAKQAKTADGGPAHVGASSSRTRAAEWHSSSARSRLGAISRCPWTAGRPATPSHPTWEPSRRPRSPRRWCSSTRRRCAACRPAVSSSWRSRRCSWRASSLCRSPTGGSRWSFRRGDFRDWR